MNKIITVETIITNIQLSTIDRSSEMTFDIFSSSAFFCYAPSAVYIRKHSLYFYAFDFYEVQAFYAFLYFFLYLKVF